MRNLGRNISLRKKIIGIIIFAIFLTVSVSFVINAIITINNFKSDLTKKLRLNSEIVSQYLVAPLDFDHQKGANEVINKLTFISSVKYIGVLDRNDSLFVSFGTNPGIKLNPVSQIEIEFLEDQIYIKNPIKYNDRYLGNLLIVSSTEELDKNINEYIYTSISSFLLILIIGFYSATKLQRYITKPIFSLSNLAREIRISGNYYLRARKESDDEVGILADELNKLLNRIQQQDRARSKYEEILKENQTRLKRAQTIAKIGSWNYDPLQKELICSDELVNIFELGKGELNCSKTDIIKLIERKDVELITEALNNNSESLKYYEFKIITERGKEKFILGAGDNILNPFGNKKLSGIFQDITQKKLAEKEITLSKKRFENIFQNAPVSLIEIDKNNLIELISKLNISYKDFIDNSDQFEPEMVDLIINELKVIDLNESAVELFEGKTKSEINENIKNLVHPKSKSRFVDLLLGIIFSRSQTSGEIEFITLKENHIYTIIKLIKLIDQKQKESILFSITDITAIEKLNKERESLLVEVKRKNIELEQIIYVASHDLRSPLVNIQGFGKELDLSIDEIREALNNENNDNLRNEIDRIVNEEIPLSLKFIRSSAIKMDSLLDGLLKLSRLGRAELTISIIDMNQLFDMILNSIQYQIKAADIKIEIHDLHNCLGDQVQINQLFTNIIDNAIKYSRKEISSFIKISSKRAGNSCIYCVEDNGIGIDKNHQQKVFEIFHRLNPDMEVKGEGLGLTIVKRILQRLNGKVWIESKINEGTKVFVELPG